MKLPSRSIVVECRRGKTRPDGPATRLADMHKDCRRFDSIATPASNTSIAVVYEIGCIFLLVVVKRRACRIADGGVTVVRGRSSSSRTMILSKYGR